MLPYDNVLPPISENMKKSPYIQFLSVLALVVFATSAQAQDIPPAVPLPSVSVEMLPAPVKLTPKAGAQTQNDERVPSTGASYDTVLMMELFSSQYCAVCLDADRHLKSFAAQEDIIALSCHNDMNEQVKSSLHNPICATRQSEYKTSFGLGTEYPAQLIIDGRHDALGFDLENIHAAITKAKNPDQFARVRKLDIKQQNSDIFSIILPNIVDAKTQGEYKIWLLAYDRPQIIKIDRGVNTNKTFEYENIVTGAGFLGKWNGMPRMLSFDPKINGKRKGFAVMVQDDITGHIIAAGKYEISQSTIYDSRMAQGNMTPMLD